MQVKNPRTGRVLLNPELFIRRLQLLLASTIRTKNHYSSASQRSRGEAIVNWTEHNKTQKAGSTARLFSLNPGDKIAIVGKVLSVNGSKCHAGKEESEIEYTVLQTRRMPQDW